MKRHRLGKLAKAARIAARASYSPYSRFKVGAAVLAGGKVYRGTNVENASYGLTICAERAAVFAAISDGNRRIDAIAIAAGAKSGLRRKAGPQNWKLPCGACRQVISEFARSTAPIVIEGWGEYTIGDLLPKPFRLK
jgi:cytidine deaminase